jgi:KUP system potassium uptake protein
MKTAEALGLTIPPSLLRPGGPGDRVMTPAGLLYPPVGLATAATVVASQALISGVFSLTHQGIRLRYIPRMTVVHTSRSVIGQIISLPAVNTMLMVVCLLLVLGFRSSPVLAGAYGEHLTFEPRVDRARALW